MLTAKSCTICDKGLPMGDNGYSLDRLAQAVKVVPADGRGKKPLCMICAERMKVYLKDWSGFRARSFARVG